MAATIKHNVPITVDRILRKYLFNQIQPKVYKAVVYYLEKKSLDQECSCCSANERMSTVYSM